MNLSSIKKAFVTCCVLCIGQQTFASNFTNGWYVSGAVGAFQAVFDSKYTDTTDLIAQTIQQTIIQHGYTGGLAVGYGQLFCDPYYLGAEFSANYNTGSANFASGAATAAFTDKIYLNYNFDFDVVPGILLTDTTLLYGKLGISFTTLSSRLTSPVGFFTIPTRFNSSHRLQGLAAGLGLKRALNPQWAVFAEYDYRDYNGADLDSFQNFTANYDHSVRTYTQSVEVGLSYNFA